MLSVGMPIFLLVPDSSKKRILHPGRVTDCKQGVFVAQLDELLGWPQGPRWWLSTPLEPSSCSRAVSSFRKANWAPGRWSRRRGIPAWLSNWSGKRFLPSSGSSIASRCRWRTSGHASAPSSTAMSWNQPRRFCRHHSPAVRHRGNGSDSFHLSGRDRPAQARVQTARPTNDGRYRYGFFIGDRISPARGAVAISMAVQRQQLRRLAGAA